LLGTEPLLAHGDLGIGIEIVVALFLGGVTVVLGLKFSFLFFNGDTIDVADFNGECESVFRETFLPSTYTYKLHHQWTTLKNFKNKKKKTILKKSHKVNIFTGKNIISLDFIFFSIPRNLHHLKGFYKLERK